ncbi:MAG: prevent-host-death protein [Gallionellaceae bacterium]|nr:MAG: prevent-host-death protein [Gallionellaceae bacterium]
MKLSTQIKPISYLSEHAAEIIWNISESREEQEQTVALLRMLAVGNKEIEQGKFRDAEDVFAEQYKTAAQ